MSLRLSDTKKEEAIAEYLDKYFYSKPSIYEFHRKVDKKTQLEGIDVTLKIKHPNLQLDTIYIDEKSAAHYVNKDIPTFAFELQFQNKLNIKTNGWLYDDKKKTTHFLLIWIQTSRKDSDFTLKDITQLEVMLIARDAVKKILSDNKFKLENLKKNILEMLSEGKNLDEKQSLYIGKLKLHYSGHLSEKSINVTINKLELKKNCIGHFIVTSAGVIKA